MKKIFLPIVLCVLMAISSLLLACAPIGEHTHEFFEVPQVEATCGKDGIRAHKECRICRYWFDEAGNKIDERDYVIPATGKHTFKDGKCTVCGTPDPEWKGDEPTEQLEWLKGEWTEEGNVEKPWTLTFDGTTIAITYNPHGELVPVTVTSYEVTSDTVITLTVEGMTQGDFNIIKESDTRITVNLGIGNAATLTKKVDEPDDPDSKYAKGMEEMVESGFELAKYSLENSTTEYIEFISGKQVKIYYNYTAGKPIDGTFGISSAEKSGTNWSINLAGNIAVNVISWSGPDYNDKWPQLGATEVMYNGHRFKLPQETPTKVTLPEAVAKIDGTWRYTFKQTDRTIVINYKESAINYYMGGSGFFDDWFKYTNTAGNDFYMLHFVIGNRGDGWLRYNPYEDKLIDSDTTTVFERENPNKAKPYTGTLPADLKGDYTLAAKGTYAFNGTNVTFTPTEGDALSYVITNVENGADANSKKITLALAEDKNTTVEFTYNLTNNTLTSGTDVYTGENLYLTKAEGIPAAIKGKYEYVGEDITNDWYYEFDAENNYKVSAHEFSGADVTYWVTEYASASKTLTLTEVTDLETGHKANAPKTVTLVYDDKANTLTLDGSKVFKINEPAPELPEAVVGKRYDYNDNYIEIKDKNTVVLYMGTEEITYTVINITYASTTQVYTITLKSGSVEGVTIEYNAHYENFKYENNTYELHKEPVAVELPTKFDGTYVNGKHKLVVNREAKTMVYTLDTRSMNLTIVGYESSTGKLTLTGDGPTEATYNESDDTVKINNATLTKQAAKPTLPDKIKENGTFFNSTTTYVFDAEAMTLTVTNYLESMEGKVTVYTIIGYDNGTFSFKDSPLAYYYDDATDSLWVNKSAGKANAVRMCTPAAEFDLVGKFVEADYGDAWIFDGTTYAFEYYSEMYARYIVKEYDKESGKITLFGGPFPDKILTYSASAKTIVDSNETTYKLEGAEEEPSFELPEGLKGEFYFRESTYTFDGYKVNVKGLKGLSNSDNTYPIVSCEAKQNGDVVDYLFGYDKGDNKIQSYYYDTAKDAIYSWSSNKKGAIAGTRKPANAVESVPLKKVYVGKPVSTTYDITETYTFDGTAYVIYHKEQVPLPGQSATTSTTNYHYFVTLFEDEEGGHITLVRCSTTGSTVKFIYNKEKGTFTEDKNTATKTVYSEQVEVPEEFNGIFAGATLAYIFNGTTKVTLRRGNGAKENWEIIEASSAEDDTWVKIKSKEDPDAAEIKLTIDKTTSIVGLIKDAEEYASAQKFAVATGIPKTIYGRYEYNGSGKFIEITEDGFITKYDSKATKVTYYLYLLHTYENDVASGTGGGQAINLTYSESANTVKDNSTNYTYTRVSSGTPEITLPEGMASKYLDENNKENYFEISKTNVKTHIDGKDKSYIVARVDGNKITLNTGDVIEFNAETFSVTYKEVKYIDFDHYDFKLPFEFPENFFGKYTYSSGVYIEVRRDGTVTWKRSGYGIEGEWKIDSFDGTYLTMTKIDGSMPGTVLSWVKDASGKMTLTYQGTKYVKAAA